MQIVIIKKFSSKELPIDNIYYMFLLNNNNNNMKIANI